MRLGLRPTVFQAGTQSTSKIGQLYGSAETVWERHRHRYEINPEYVAQIEKGAEGSKTLGTKRPFVRRTSVASAELEYEDDEPEDKPDRLRFIGKQADLECSPLQQMLFTCFRSPPGASNHWIAL